MDSLKHKAKLGYTPGPLPNIENQEVDPVVMHSTAPYMPLQDQEYGINVREIPSYPTLQPPMIAGPRYGQQVVPEPEPTQPLPKEKDVEKEAKTSKEKVKQILRALKVVFILKALAAIGITVFLFYGPTADAGETVVILPLLSALFFYGAGIKSGKKALRKSKFKFINKRFKYVIINYCCYWIMIILVTVVLCGVLEFKEYGPPPSHHGRPHHGRPYHQNTASPMPDFQIAYPYPTPINQPMQAPPVLRDGEQFEMINFVDMQNDPVVIDLTAIFNQMQSEVFAIEQAIQGFEQQKPENSVEFEEEYAPISEPWIEYYDDETFGLVDLPPSNQDVSLEVEDDSWLDRDFEDSVLELPGDLRNLRADDGHKSKQHGKGKHHGRGKNNEKGKRHEEGKHHGKGKNHGKRENSRSDVDDDNLDLFVGFVVLADMFLIAMYISRLSYFRIALKKLEEAGKSLKKDKKSKKDKKCKKHKKAKKNRKIKVEEEKSAPVDDSLPEPSPELNPSSQNCDADVSVDTEAGLVKKQEAPVKPMQKIVPSQSIQAQPVQQVIQPQQQNQGLPSMIQYGGKTYKLVKLSDLKRMNVQPTYYTFRR